jgi:hypothetical protein
METTLSQAESTRLISVLKELAGEPPVVEHRRYKRRSVAMGVWVKFISQGRARHQSCRVMLNNISARGVGILSLRPLAMGDRVVLRLPFKEGGGWLVLASVRNCIPTGQGSFRAGAEFVSWTEDPTGETPIPRDWVVSWN